MKIRFKKRWKQYDVGDTCDTLPPGVCMTMIERHVAEEVQDETTKRQPRADKSMARRKVKTK